MITNSLWENLDILYDPNVGPQGPQGGGPNQGQNFPQQNTPAGFQKKVFQDQHAGLKNGVIARNYSPNGVRKFYQWQQAIYRRLFKKDDVFVVAPPGGGKTTPLVAYWTNACFLGIKNPTEGIMNLNEAIQHGQNLDEFQDVLNTFYCSRCRVANSNNKDLNKQLLFITPIRTLAQEQATSFSEILFDFALWVRSMFLRGIYDTFAIQGASQGEEFDLIQKIMMVLCGCTTADGSTNRNRYLRFLSALGFISGNTIQVGQVQQLQAICQNAGINFIMGNRPEDRIKLILVLRILLGFMPNSGSVRIRDIFNYLHPNNSKFEATIHNYVSNELISVQTGGGGGSFGNASIDRALIVIGTYDKVKGSLGQLKRVRFTVFDEAHLYAPSEPVGGDNRRSQNTEARAAEAAYAIVSALDKSHQIGFLSGTINPDSAKRFSDFLNRQYGRKIQVESTTTGDPEALNKTQLVVIEDDGLLRDSEVIRRIVDMINRRNAGNAFIYFSKSKIQSVCEEVLKRTGGSTLQSVDKRGASSGGYMKFPTITPPGVPSVRDPYQSTGKPSEGMLYQDQDRQKVIEKLKKLPGALNIKNKFLRECVAHGFGFIFRKDDTDMNGEKVSEDDKLIVANLFSNHKIYVLISTSAIGVGINVNIRRMYIPTLRKTESLGGFEKEQMQISMRDLSQLINRVGRGKVDFGGIYTPRENKEYLEQVVNMGVNDYPDVPTIRTNTRQVLRDFPGSVKCTVKDWLINLRDSAKAKTLNV